MCLVLNLEGRRPRLRPVVAAGKGAVPAGRRSASTDSRAATAPHALFRVKLVDLDNTKAGRPNSPTSAKALAVGALAGSPAADCPPPVRQGPLTPPPCGPARFSTGVRPRGSRGTSEPPSLQPGRPAARPLAGRRITGPRRYGLLPHRRPPTPTAGPRRRAGTRRSLPAGLPPRRLCA